MLDSSHFHGVPPTAFVEMVHHSFKDLPYEGFEVVSEEYRSVIETLITPPQRTDKEAAANLTPESNFSTSAQSRETKGLQQSPSFKRAGDSVTEKVLPGLKYGSLQFFV